MAHFWTTTEGTSIPTSNQQITSHLLHHDEARAVDWMVRVSGFQETQRSPGQRELRLGNATVMTGTPPGAFRNPRELGGLTQPLLLHVDDVDAHYQRARASGQTAFAEELHLEDYGAGARSPIRRVIRGTSPVGLTPDDAPLSMCPARPDSEACHQPGSCCPHRYAMAAWWCTAAVSVTVEPCDTMGEEWKVAKIAFWITAGPDQADKALTGLRLAERLKNGKEQDVKVFLYGPGVRLASAGGPLEEAVRALTGSAIPVQVCPFNAKSQDVAHEVLLDRGVNLDETASEALIRWVEEGYQVIGV